MPSLKRNINSPIVVNPFSFNWQSPYFSYFTSQVKFTDLEDVNWKSELLSRRNSPFKLSKVEGEHPQQCQSPVIEAPASPTVSSFNQSTISSSSTTFLSCVLPPTSSRGGVYISDLEYASQVSNLEQNNITCVLSIDRRAVFTLPLQYNHMTIIALDTCMERISQHFDSTYAFIVSAIQSGKNVLVHCRRGISRSATIVAAFMMKFFNQSYENVMKTLLAVRPIVKPNEGFVKKLRAHEAILRDYLIQTYQDPNTTQPIWPTNGLVD